MSVEFAREGEVTATGGMVPEEISWSARFLADETNASAVTSPPAPEDGRSDGLEEIVRPADPGVPRVRPANPMPRCRNCGGLWDSGPELLCRDCSEAFHDLFREESA